MLPAPLGRGETRKQDSLFCKKILLTLGKGELRIEYKNRFDWNNSRGH